MINGTVKIIESKSSNVYNVLVHDCTWGLLEFDF